MRQKHTVLTQIKKGAVRQDIAKELLTVDYPQEGEAITGPDYTFRISAPQDAQGVELCINQGPWQPCRQASGYWWFDCSDISCEPYQARARMHTKDGKEKLTMLRRFQAVR